MTRTVDTLINPLGVINFVRWCIVSQPVREARTATECVCVCVCVCIVRTFVRIWIGREERGGRGGTVDSAEVL